MQVGSEGPKLAHRLVVAIRWHAYVVRRAADVDAGGVRDSLKKVHGYWMPSVDER
jgi:hypothetical protein